MKKAISILSFLLLCTIVFGLPEQPFDIIKEQVRIPMRDGIRLGATLYRPAAEGRYPAIVFRTPYSKDDYDSQAEFPLKAAKEGYLVFLVDVRGRYTSEGKFEAYRNEKRDGYDVIEWVGHSQYCSGKVGSYGRSYPGYVQWLALSQGPPSYATAVPEMTPIHSHQFFYVGGAFSYSWFDWFMINILPDLRKKANDTSGTWNEEEAAKKWQSEKVKWYLYRPLGENPLVKKYAPYYYDWLTHQERTDFWDFASVEKDFPKMKAPVLLISGWYDSAYGPLGATDGFNLMRKEGGSKEAREETRLLLGPWNHGSISVRKMDLGIQSNGPSAGMDYDAYLLDWFDRQLKAKKEEIIPPVSIFVMGANRWRYENEWPLARAVETSYYLQSAGDASMDRERGKLSTTLPTKQPADRYVFDPNFPLWDPTYEQSFPFDQKDLETRKDVLVYSTEPLAQDVEVTGPIVAELYVSSSAKDTDFAVTFCDVRPDGTSVNLSSLDAGFLRMRFRNGFDKQEFIEPGKIYKIRIDNMYTSNLFQKGHRIRLQITSSKTPHYDPNTNTGTDLATETRLLNATQTIYHDKDHPSRLILPVIKH
jgi:putative CocE/NonD family hydrolase